MRRNATNDGRNRELNRKGDQNAPRVTLGSPVARDGILVTKGATVLTGAEAQLLHRLQEVASIEE